MPHRVEEGYGLNAEAVRAWGDGKAALLVTVDCGIAAVEEAALARQLGLDLIVTDHHEPRRAAARGGGHRPSRACPAAAIRSAV